MKLLVTTTLTPLTTIAPMLKQDTTATVNASLMLMVTESATALKLQDVLLPMLATTMTQLVMTTEHASSAVVKMKVTKATPALLTLSQ